MTQTMSGLNVAIIDANPLLADGLALLLRSDGTLVADLVYLGPTWQRDQGSFDVIILDPAQAPVCPEALVEEIGTHAQAILGYSSVTSERLGRACIAAGFRGVLPKTVPFQTLKIALSTVASGSIFIDAAFAAVIAAEAGVDVSANHVQEARLSAREMFVLKSVAHGKSMKEIGKELDLSSKTIETYKARGSSKLNLSGRRQIVEFAIAQGWVAPTERVVG